MLIRNRYQILDELGMGAFGVVYRVYDKLTGHELALKQLHTDPIYKSRINERVLLANEFQTLAALRHPNIINVQDFGFDEAQRPFVTMQLLQDAPNLLTAARNQPLSYKLQLFSQTLEAIAYLHRRGILHRDLKPANILVVDGIVKVLDFGLAVSAEHFRDKTIVGTPAYIAPEVWRSKSATRQTDLYALGIIAYKMLTGIHPFQYAIQSGDLMQIMTAHLNQSPDWDLLDSVLKSQSDTLTHSAMGTESESVNPIAATNAPSSVDRSTIPIDAHSTFSINESLRALLNNQHAMNLDDTLPPAHGYPQEPISGIVYRLVAKRETDRYDNVAEVIHDLQMALDVSVSHRIEEIRESYLQAATFIGRQDELAQLTHQLQDAVNRRGSLWLVGGESGVGKSRLMHELRIQALAVGVQVFRGQALNDGALSYQIWRDIMRPMVLHANVDDFEASVLKEIVPDIAQLLDRPIADLPRLSGEASKTRLLGVIGDIIKRQETPTLILLEDLQWATQSLEVLENLSDAIHTLPILIVGNFRDDEAPDLPNQLPLARVMKLRRLANEEIAQLSRSMLGELGVDARLVTLLEQETEGNVFFVVEVVRALAEHAGHLGDISANNLPEHVLTGGMRHVLKGRINSIPPQFHAWLEIAALVGRQIDQQLLPITFKGTSELIINNWLGLCVNNAVFDLIDNTYRFAHDKLREYIIDETPNDRKKQHSRLIAEAIETAYAGNSAYDEVLLEHWHRAGDIDRELDYLVSIAMRRNELSADFEQTRALLARGIANAPQDDGRLPILYFALGHTYFYQSAFAEARQAAQKAFALAEDAPFSEAMWGARNLLGILSIIDEQYEVASKHLNDALHIAIQLGEQLRIAQTTNNLGINESRRGQPKAAIAYYDQSLNLAEELQDNRQIGATLANRALVFQDQGLLDEAEQDLRRALSLHTQDQDRYSMGVALNNLAETLTKRQAYEEAIAAFEESRQLHQQIGDTVGVIIATNGKASAYVMNEQYEPAQTLLAEAMQLSLELDMQSLLKSSLAIGSELLFGMGKPQHSVELLGLIGAQDAIEGAAEKFRTLLSQDDMQNAYTHGTTLNLTETVIDLISQWAKKR